MRGLSRRLSARTRLKSIASLLVGAGLVTGMAAVQAGSLLEPGTTTYLYELQSDVPLEIGEAHTVILDTDDSSFFLTAPLINHGVVHWAAAGKFGEVFAFSMGDQINRGRWIIDNGIEMHLEGALDNHGGVVQIGANSNVLSGQPIIGGRIHGLSSTSNLSAHSLTDVTITGQVNLGLKSPSSIGGTLTVKGTLGIQAVNLSESTLLQGSGQTVLKNGTIGASAGAIAPELILAAGHTLSGTGRITNVALLTQGAIEVNRSDVLRTDSSIVQQGNDALLVVKGNLQAPQIQIQGGVVDLHNTSYVKGDVDVQQGRLMLHQFTHIEPDSLGGLGAIIEGDLTLSDQSEVEVIVGQGYPLAILEVWGNVSLGGDLIVSFVDGAKAPSTFELAFMASSVQGTFRSLRVNGTGSLPWTFVQNSNGLITITAVPEPETWGLMLCGLGVVAWRLRRRTALQATH